jgi:NAD(P)-dependent dehydrogenase (short-subunit alcohol dehydrogenase family)
MHLWLETEMRKWLITGVSSGLGRALALAVAAQGDRVAGTVRNRQAQQDFAAIRPGLCQGFLLDVTDHDAVATAVCAADEALGGIDVLVNNAGYSFEGTLEETAWADLYGQFAANVFGPVAVMKAVLPLMRLRRRGLIVNITSVAGYVTGAGIGAYGGAKLALEAISRALSQEVAPFGIQVMTVIPGAFRTELGRNRRSAENMIEDYWDQNVARRQRLAALSGHQRGDPRKAAMAIIAAVQAPNPPRRLVLGIDAVAAVADDMRQFDAEIQAWKHLSEDLDLDGAI